MSDIENEFNALIASSVELPPEESVDHEVIQRTLTHAFDPTIGPFRPDEVRTDVIRDILYAAFDPGFGPVRPDEVHQDAIRGVLKAATSDSEATVGNAKATVGDN
jgi:hypothetical protein